MKKNNRFISWESVNTISKESDSEGFDDDDDFDEFEDFDQIGNKQKGFMVFKQPRVDYTPLGPVNGDDPFNPLNRYDIFIGSTYGFKVDATLLLTISEKVEGIDILRPISPYSFLIAPARMYEWSEVRYSIEKIIGQHDTEIDRIVDDGVKKAVTDIETHLIKSEQPYFIYVLPNGHVVYRSLIQDDFDDILVEVEESFKQTPKAILIKHEC